MLVLTMASLVREYLLKYISRVQRYILIGRVVRRCARPSRPHERARETARRSGTIESNGEEEEEAEEAEAE